MALKNLINEMRNAFENTENRWKRELANLKTET